MQIAPPKFRPEVIQAAVAHARREAPRESCGVLGGVGGVVSMAQPVTNIASGDANFLLDPLEAARAELAIREAGLAVAGYYHSHPHGSLEPSEADRVGTLDPLGGPGWRLIVTPAGEWGLFDSEKNWMIVDASDSGVLDLPA